jgi:isocitrate dehydrogenase kinase/phosphatase
MASNPTSPSSRTLRWAHGRALKTPTGWAYTATIERIDLYKVKLNSVLGTVELVAGDELRNYEFLARCAQDLRGPDPQSHNFEIAETFYNSVFNAVFQHKQVRNDYAFVFSSQGDIPLADSSPVLRYYQAGGSVPDTLRKLLLGLSLQPPV